MRKTVRSAAITLAGLFIGISLLGILRVWWIDHHATEMTLKGFGLVESVGSVVDTWVARMNGLITTSRTELDQASETIRAVGAQAQANRPVLNALNETPGDKSRATHRADAAGAVSSAGCGENSQ